MDTSDILIEQLRAYYLAGVEDAGALEDGLALAEGIADPEATVKAYQAALTVLQAKHAFWPLKKMRYLNEGLPVLDDLVARHPDHVEIRYLRLLSCYYLPRFLGRSDTVQEDVHTLARLLPQASTSFPQALYEDMVHFVSSADVSPQSEQRPLQHISITEDDETASSSDHLSKQP